MQLIDHLTLPAKLTNLPKMLDMVIQTAASHGIEGKRIMEIELALEEALVNIFNYAYPDDIHGDVTVRCLLNDEGQLQIEIEDQGRAFDVLSVADPDVTVDLSDRDIGGLGIFLIKKLMRSVSYHRRDHKNILRLTV
jgi:anti-sigma regulatory factor (Ser/Thr protein kinase)